MHSILFHFILFYSILFYFILFYSIIFYFIPFYSILLFFFFPSPFLTPPPPRSLTKAGSIFGNSTAYTIKGKEKEKHDRKFEALKKSRFVGGGGGGGGGDGDGGDGSDGGDGGGDFVFSHFKK